MFGGLFNTYVTVFKILAMHNMLTIVIEVECCTFCYLCCIQMSMLQVITTVNNAAEKSYLDTMIPNHGM